MTPFRQAHQQGVLSGVHGEPASGVRLFAQDNDDQEMDRSMSPPRVSKNANLHSTDLFGAADHNEASMNQTNRGNRRRVLRARQSSSPDESFISDISVDGSVLRNMDMNTSSTSSPSNATSPTRRKRPSEGHPAGREEFMDETSDTDNDDMFVSPRSGSPTYRTIDGRTVTSKNPFSPYTPTQHDCDNEMMNADTLQSAPSFPISLYGSQRSFDSNNSCKDGNNNNNPSSSSLAAGRPINIRPKMNLLRRDGSPQEQEQQQQSTAAAARAGYPDSHGRYSFTGSPIAEMDFLEDQDDCTHMGSKIRRLKLDEDTSTTAAAHTLFVDTSNKKTTGAEDNDVSPTDVLNFPPPPAPKKPARPRYTPLSNNKLPPQTPMPGRRSVARRPQDPEDDDMGSSSGPPKSRFYQDFDIIGELGTGSFGTVYKCLSRLDGCMYAVKAAKRKAKGNADRDRMLKEVYALAALSDQADTAAFHCVRYHQAWMEEDRLYIQTEMCTSTLQSEMNRGRLSDVRKWKLLREMLLALEFIHRNGMVHLDIKPENIFVKNDQFKLGDFGLVSQITNHNEVEEGDSRYMSKELLSGDHEDLTKSDIFSLGATMYEVCLGRPLPTDGQEWQDIRSGSLLPLHGTPYEMELLIKRMMHPNPQARPSASELLKQPQLLSDEQKQLMAEKSKVLEANLALALQTQKLKRLTPPRRGALIRANTWNGTNNFI